MRITASITGYRVFRLTLAQNKSGTPSYHFPYLSQISTRAQRRLIAPCTYASGQAVPGKHTETRTNTQTCPHQGAPASLPSRCARMSCRFCWMVSVEMGTPSSCAMACCTRFTNAPFPSPSWDCVAEGWRSKGVLHVGKQRVQPALCNACDASSSPCHHPLLLSPGVCSEGAVWGQGLKRACIKGAVWHQCTAAWWACSLVTWP